MSPRMKRYLILILCLLLAFAGTAVAQDDSDYPVNTITVAGTGVAYGEPDMARVEIGVELTDPSLNAAFEEVNQRLDAVISALQDMGISEDDIRTTGLNVFAQEPPIGPGMQESEQPQTEYRVSNRVMVTINDIEQVEAVISAAIDAGANNIFNLQFDISDPSALAQEARRSAISEAQEQAQQIADILNLELGRPIVIVQNSGTGGRASLPAFAEGIGGGGAVVEPGRFSVQVSVQITYRIASQ